MSDQDQARDAEIVPVDCMISCLVKKKLDEGVKAGHECAHRARS